MNSNNKPISVSYSDEKLRVLTEEYITMQKASFTFRGLCSYILYRAREEERTANKGLYETNQLSQADAERVSALLRKIIVENRLTTAPGCGDAFADETVFTKVKE